MPWGKSQNFWLHFRLASREPPGQTLKGDAFWSLLESLGVCRGIPGFHQQCANWVHNNRQGSEQSTFWRFSGGHRFSRVRFFSRNSSTGPFKFDNIIDIHKYPCKPTCLYSAPSFRNEKSSQRGSFRPDVPADIRPITLVRPSKSWKNKHLARTCRAHVHEKTSVWETSGWFFVPYSLHIVDIR